jgi:S1-C subfamily serine protease
MLLSAQQTDEKADREKKVVITKRSKAADGTETSETIVKKGKAAEEFDVDKFIKENRKDNVQVEVKVIEGGEEEIWGKGERRGWNWNNGGNWGRNFSWNDYDDDDAFLGVEEDSDENEDEAGLVVQVVRNSAAGKAGLKTNDKILKLNDTKVDKWDDLVDFMDKMKPGDKIKITYLRDGKEATTEAALTRRDEVKRGDLKRGFLGVSDRDDDDRPGVEVSITRNSAADKAGLRSGDVIFKLNDTEIADYEDISDFMNESHPGDKVRIVYERNGQKNTAEAILGDFNTGSHSYNYNNDDNKGYYSYSHSSDDDDNERAFLGVEEDSDEDEDEDGLVVEIVRGAAAAKAGLKTNDKILKLNDTPLKSWEDLTDFMRRAKPGDKVKITYARNGKEMTAETTLTSRDDVKKDKYQRGFLGVSDRDDDDEDALGVEVSITRNSAADKAGLRSGDVILGLDDAEIRDYEDISDFMDETAPGQKIKITYERNGQKNTVEATLGEVKDWSSFNSSGNWNWDNNDGNWNDVNINVRSKEACLGVYTETIGEGTDQGARINDFTNESAALEVRLNEGDIITAVNGFRVRGQGELWNEISRYKPGEKVTVEYLRENQKQTAEATLKACKDKNNRITLFDTDETGDKINRRFYTWNWGDEEKERMRKRQIITIHRGEGDAPKLNSANAAVASDRKLVLQSYRAYPNPTQGQLTVEFRGEAVPTVVSLYDLAGRQLFREELNAFDGAYNQQFDLSEYAKGNVMVQVQQGDKVYTEQVVVN